MDELGRRHTHKWGCVKNAAHILSLSAKRRRTCLDIVKPSDNTAATHGSASVFGVVAPTLNLLEQRVFGVLFL